MTELEIGRLAEALVVAAAETCLAASIRDLEKLSQAMAGIELAMIQRAEMVAELKK